MLSMDWKTSIRVARADNTTWNKNAALFTECLSPETNFITTSYFDADLDMVLFAADVSKKLLVLHSFKNA